ncbi:hypothetical protein ACRAWF_29015 [Streptomyces sp. L7]
MQRSAVRWTPSGAVRKAVLAISAHNDRAREAVLLGTDRHGRRCTTSAASLRSAFLSCATTPPATWALTAQIGETSPCPSSTMPGWITGS